MEGDDLLKFTVRYHYIHSYHFADLEGNCASQIRLVSDILVALDLDGSNVLHQDSPSTAGALTFLMILDAVSMPLARCLGMGLRRASHSSSPHFSRTFSI